MYRTKTNFAKKTASPFSSYAAQPQRASPYAFEYAADGSSRQESSDASGKVTGSYTVLNEDGSKRLVKYVADEQGFRAQVDTDEPGTKSDSPASVQLQSSAAQPAPAKYSTTTTQKKFQAPIMQQKASPFSSDFGASPYSFSYQAQLKDGSSSRQESADASGRVKGSYSLSNMDGRRRTVDYSADQAGFKASVDTNEFGTKSDSPADVTFFSSAAEKQQAPSQKAAYQPMSYHSQSQIGDNEYQPSPYAYEYSAQLEDGGSISRQESADASGKVTGLYKFYVADGRQRSVEYQADHEGFRASVNTNEFGTKSDSPANVAFYSSAPEAEPLQRPAPQKTSSVKFTGQALSASQYNSFGRQEPLQTGYAGKQMSSPYSFSYANQMDDGSSSRSESLDSSGKVTGSYSLSTISGGQRTVDYTADEGGFRANVKTNEYGTKSDSPADVVFQSTAPQDYPAEPQSSFQPQVQQKAIQFPVDDSPKPYSFNYNVDLNGGSSGRQESGDSSGKVVGSYSMSNIDGRSRTVDYTAGKAGFQASVKTNEFGTKSDSPAHVQFHSTAGQRAQTASKKAFQKIETKKSAFQIQQQKVEPFAQEFPSFPYSFNYNAESSARQEASDDSGKVTGSYSVKNEDGSTRIVEYVADEGGFRAKVKTDEPGTKSDSPADVSLHSSAQEAHSGAQQKFPQHTYSQKSSMISQKHIY